MKQKEKLKTLPNGYQLSRQWFDYCFENPEKIHPGHSAIYFFAIEQCNRLGWKEKFGFPASMVMEATGIKSYNTYIKTLHELIDMGFIILVQKSKNQYTTNIIALSFAISKDNKALDKAINKANIKATEKQRKSKCTILKPINYITNKPINKQTPEERESEILNSRYFKYATKLKNIICSFRNQQISIKILKQWSEEIRKINTSDGFSVREIKEVLSWYEKHIGEEYTPVVWSGSAFRNKFNNLLSAIERKTKSRKKQTGAEQRDSTKADLPKAIREKEKTLGTIS